jgi:hypothetical protein
MRIGWIWGIVVVGALGCGSSSPSMDSDAATTCTSDDVCDDGQFCNGAERCRPDDSMADDRGCVLGEVPCLEGQACDEDSNACVSQCAIEPDADDDGVAAIACGGSDCDDTNPGRAPGLTEVCDVSGIDEDCDPSTFGVRDADGDGFPDARCCNGATCGTDCDDTLGSVHPTANEVCNEVDDDCDGSVDEGARRRFWPDTDRDGFGDRDAIPVEGCLPPVDHVENDLDCDDSVRAVNPATTELCDAIDNDCDGDVDEEGARTFYRDRDEDGFGDPDEVVSIFECAIPTGYAPIGTDCNDADPTQHPGAGELCNRRDDDCSQAGVDRGGVDPTEDFDQDGHAPLAQACEGGLPKDDCDDTRSHVFTGALERCNGIDDDCDTVVDDGADAFCGRAASCELGACVATDALAVSNVSTCRIDGGRVDCWSRFGILRGDGMPDAVPATAGRVVGLEGARQVAVSQSTRPVVQWNLSADCELACAVRDDGRVVCWGRNGAGQLGNGGMSSSPTPVEVVGITDAVEVGLGQCHACARRRDGSVACWGENLFGQLADGTVTSRNVPVPIAGVTDAVELAVGGIHACARLASGRVRCWGSAERGALGNDTTVTAMGSSLVLRAAGVPLEPVESLTAGYGYTCFSVAGEVLCSGAPGARAVAGVGAPDALLPQPVPTLSGERTWVEGSSDRTLCAGATDGSVACWGANREGVRGETSRSDVAVPSSVAALVGFDEIALGGSIGCGRVGRDLSCWGRVGFPDAGGDGGASRAAPVVGLGASSVHSGTCAVDAMGRFRCWGPSIAERADTLSFQPFALRGSSVPYAVPELDGAVSVADRSSQVCAVLADGQVACFGRLHDARGPVVEIAGVTDARQIELSNIACVRLADGSLQCWREDVAARTPVAMGGGTGWVDFALGDIPSRSASEAGGPSSATSFVCAVDAAGALSCWGRAASRLRGMPLATTPTPFDVGGAVRRVAIRRSRDDTCVARVDGAVFCAGAFADADGNDQLDGPTAEADAIPFVQVVGVSDAVEVVVAGGGFRTSTACALESDGDVLCWGHGASGELGRRVPGSLVAAPVDGLDDATSIAATNGTFCANSASRGLVCWGDDWLGSLGRGAVRPVTILP